MSTFRLVSYAFAAALSLAAATATATTATAQKAPAGKADAARSLAGQWTGTVSVPLADSTLTVPVFYTFTDSAGVVAGTAMVPGQGAGPISHVVRDGSAIRFRVTVKQAEKTRLLEHDAKIGADGAIEGMVNLEGKPIAKFRIASKK